MNDDLKTSSTSAENGSKSVGRLAGKAGKFAGRQVKKLSRKFGRNMIGSVLRLIAKIGKALIQILIRVAMLLGPIGVFALCFVIFAVSMFIFVLEERGSNESNNLDPEMQNPSYIDSVSGITKAVAMTEPQAVIDAYYKYLACSSYVKTYSGKVFEFNDPEENSDFAGLRDYYKVEDNFYLADDFIRTVDEMLHQDQFYFPEQVIKPVWGQFIELKDKNGQTGKYYTSRLPYDTPDGESMLNEELVKDFSDMLADGEKLTVAGADGKSSQLLAQSQIPNAIEGSNIYYNLIERNVVDTSDTSITTEKGLWDYGFASVLQYQPEQKMRYIECTYDKVDVDFDYRDWDFDIHDWGPWEHGYVETKNVPEKVDELKEDCAEICAEKTSALRQWRYQLPNNIEAIVDNSKAWNMSAEPNSGAEQVYATVYEGERPVVNNHIDMKIEDAWDAEIDQIKFEDNTLKADYGNAGGGLYPIKIAIASHAATFSGNIHYTITPAGTEGCIVEKSELRYNSQAVADQREPVQTVQVGGGCSEANLTAHRTGTYTMQRPYVEETTSPWGFEYLEEFSAYYRGYVPEDYKEDRDFFVRTGLVADEGSEEKKVYAQNLDFLMDLGLLRLYNGNISLGTVGSVDLSALSDPNSDLYILSHVIAAESGPNKLDELMVGSVFVNRVQSDRFPNTFQEVLQQAGQYACYTDGNYQKAKPTDSEITSAIQVLTGQFTIPENILGQSAFKQGTIYTIVDNPSPYNDHYYCTMGSEDISSVDRFGRPAPDATQLQTLADQLEGVSPDQAGASAASIDYSSTAFIGDSLTVGLDQSQGLSSNGALVIAEVGNTIRQALQDCSTSSELGPNIRTVYLLIGTNSCGLDDKVFKEQYLELLRKIDEKTNGAQIILTSLPPVIDGRSSATNRFIDAKNQVISSIASENGYKVLDIHTALTKNDQLNEEYSADGLHLTPAGYQVWFSKIQSGLVSSGVSEDPSNSFTVNDEDGIPILSSYTLYEISDFDVLTATNMQARLKQADAGLIASLEGLLDGMMESVDDFIHQFFEGISKVFSAPSSTSYFKYGTPYNNYDVKSTVYHSIAFSNQVWFSTAESKADNMSDTENGLMFLFVGKNKLLGFGTTPGSNVSAVPGVGTSVEGMISPTDTYYQTLKPYSPAEGFMEISTPKLTNILAVADGTITEVGTDTADFRGRYVIQTAILNGDEYEITYGYLNSISVIEGKSVGQGDLIGLSGVKQDGTAALYLSVRKNGELINPATIFYQMSYGTGTSLGGNLNNADGTVNESLISALNEKLTAEVESGGCQYHRPPLNTLQYKQCTWWACGRGFEYLQSIGSTMSFSEYRTGIRGNGGQYAANNAAAGLFKSGSTPKPNSIVCYPGNPGHVAYVEAVDYVNQYYYQSEAGSGSWWGGITKKPFGYAAKGSGGQYGQGVFIYLDEPL